MLRLAVVGKDVSQSLSPSMHTFILHNMGADCTYDRVSIPEGEFAARADALFDEYDAFNVTIPFKQEIIPHLEHLCGDAADFGAVNTVLSGTRSGYNTDGFGFLLMLQNHGVEIEGKSFLVLGAGGAGRSCIRKLTQAGAKVSAFERSEERLNEVYKEFGGFTPLCEVPVKPFDVIVNCTGIGMHRTVGQTPEIVLEGGVRAPVGRDLLSLCDTAVDLIYVPAQSEFLRIAAQEGKKTVNGASMLFYQAYMADCVYLGCTPKAEQARALWKAYREE